MLVIRESKQLSSLFKEAKAPTDTPWSGGSLDNARFMAVFCIHISQSIAATLLALGGYSLQKRGIIPVLEDQAISGPLCPTWVHGGDT